eukprot:10808247-Ditylum_brightwellii.AAC.1
MKPCESCAVGKARQKKAKKHSDHEKADRPGKQIFTDISTIKGTKNGPKVNTKRRWLILVDEHSTLCMSSFHTTKNGMVEPTLEKFSRWEKSQQKVEYVRCDNAGENKTLEKRSRSKDWKMNLQFEYTARAMPQQNYLAELAFSTLGSK